MYMYMSVCLNQTSDAVKEAQKIQAVTEDKLLVARKKAMANAKERENKLSATRKQVKRVR